MASVESGNLLKFLMSLDKPSPRLMTSIEGGLAWLEGVKITGIRRGEIGGRQTYVQDPASEQVYWARFYDLGTNKPMFPGSEDGVIYDSYAAMAANNHSTGYDFLSTRPSSAVKTEQRKWRERLAEAGDTGGDSSNAR